MVEILADFFVLMVFFYRRFLPLDVCLYACGAENDDSSSDLPIPFVIFGKTEKDQMRPKKQKTPQRVPAIELALSTDKKAFLREEGGTRQGFPEASELSFGGSLRSVTEGARATLNLY